MHKYRFIVQVISNIIGFLFAGAILSGLTFQNGLLTVIVVGAIMGILNFFLKPILKFLTFPLLILSLGLFSIFINIGLLYLAELIVPGFEIDTFSTAFLATIILSIINTIIFWVMDDKKS
jgi:putative membrane protein